jgi:hypothetical protein
MSGESVMSAGRLGSTTQWMSKSANSNVSDSLQAGSFYPSAAENMGGSEQLAQTNNWIPNNSNIGSGEVASTTNWIPNNSNVGSNEPVNTTKWVTKENTNVGSSVQSGSFFNDVGGNIGSGAELLESKLLEAGQTIWDAAGNLVNGAKQTVFDASYNLNTLLSKGASVATDEANWLISQGYQLIDTGKTKAYTYIYNGGPSDTFNQGEQVTALSEIYEWKKVKEINPFAANTKDIMGVTQATTTKQTLDAAQAAGIPVSWDNGKYTINEEGAAYERDSKRLMEIQDKYAAQNQETVIYGGSTSSKKKESGIFGLFSDELAPIDELVYDKITKYLPDTEAAAGSIKNLWEDTLPGYTMKTISDLVNTTLAKNKTSTPATDYANAVSQLYSGINKGVEDFALDQYTSIRETPVSYVAETYAGNKAMGYIFGAGTKTAELTVEKILSTGSKAAEKTGAKTLANVLEQFSGKSSAIVNIPLGLTFAGQVTGETVDAYKKGGVAGATESILDTALSLKMMESGFKEGSKAPSKVIDAVADAKLMYPASKTSITIDAIKAEATGAASIVSEKAGTIASKTKTVLEKILDGSDSGFKTDYVDTNYADIAKKNTVLQKSSSGTTELKEYASKTDILDAYKTGEANRANASENILKALSGESPVKKYTENTITEQVGHTLNDKSASKKSSGKSVTYETVVPTDITNIPGYGKIKVETSTKNGEPVTKKTAVEKLNDVTVYDITDVVSYRESQPTVINKPSKITTEASIIDNVRDAILGDISEKNTKALSKLRGKSYQEIRDINQTSAFDTELNNLKYFNDEYMQESKGTKLKKQTDEMLASRQQQYDIFETNIAGNQGYNKEYTWLNQESFREGQTNTELAKKKAQKATQEKKLSDSEELVNNLTTDVYSQTREADANIDKKSSIKKEKKAKEFFANEYMAEDTNNYKTRKNAEFDTRLNELKAEKVLEDMAATSARFDQVMPGDIKTTKKSLFDKMMDEAEGIQYDVNKSSAIDRANSIREKTKGKFAKEQEAKKKAKTDYAANNKIFSGEYEVVAPTDITDVASYKKEKKMNRKMKDYTWDSKFDKYTWDKEIGPATSEYSKADRENSFKSTEDIIFDSHLDKIKEQDFNNAVENLKKGKDVNGNKTEKTLMDEWDSASYEIPNSNRGIDIDKTLKKAPTDKFKESQKKFRQNNEKSSSGFSSEQGSGNPKLLLETKTDIKPEVKTKTATKIKTWEKSDNLEKMLSEDTRTRKKTRVEEKTEEQRDIVGRLNKVSTDNGVVKTAVKGKKSEAVSISKPKTMEQIISSVNGSVEPKSDVIKLDTVKTEKKASTKKKEKTYYMPYSSGGATQENIVIYQLNEEQSKVAPKGPGSAMDSIIDSITKADSRTKPSVTNVIFPTSQNKINPPTKIKPVSVTTSKSSNIPKVVPDTVVKLINSVVNPIDIPTPTKPTTDTKTKTDTPTIINPYTETSTIIPYPTPSEKKGRTDIIPGKINTSSIEIYKIIDQDWQPVKSKLDRKKSKDTDISEKWGKKKKTYKNTFGSIESFNRAMAKADRGFSKPSAKGMKLASPKSVKSSINISMITSGSRKKTKSFNW